MQGRESRKGRASAAVSALVETLQRGDAVIFLEIGRFGRGLRRVERNLFRIFLSLDFDKARQLAVSRLPPDLCEMPRARARYGVKNCGASGQ